MYTRPTAEEFTRPLVYIRSLISDPKVLAIGAVSIRLPPGMTHRPPALASLPQDLHLPAVKVLALKEMLSGEGIRPSVPMTMAEYMDHATREAEAAGTTLEGGSEEAFWRHVELGPDKVVHYASDVPPETLGEADVGPEGGEGGGGGFRMADLPRAEGSLLKLVEAELSGVTSPWYYLGMRFSCFCLHHEDNNLCSASLLHEGGDKIWYIVPRTEMAKLSKVGDQMHPLLAVPVCCCAVSSWARARQAAVLIVLSPVGVCVCVYVCLCPCSTYVARRGTSTRPRCTTCASWLTPRGCAEQASR